MRLGFYWFVYFSFEDGGLYVNVKCGRASAPSLQATGSFWLGGLSLTLREIVTWTACNATSLVS